jgi:hypothetical protein
VPIDLKVKNSSPIKLKLNQTFPLDILVARQNTTPSSLLSLNGIEISLAGMTDSGLQGLTYVAQPQRFNLTEVPSINGTIELTVDAKDAVAGNYTLMTRISTLEKDRLTISELYPQTVVLDVPAHEAQIQNFTTLANNENSNSTFTTLRDLARYVSVGVAITLIAYLVYRKIKERKLKRNSSVQ